MSLLLEHKVEPAATGDSSAGTKTESPNHSDNGSGGNGSGGNGTSRRRSLYGFEMRDTDHRRNDEGRKTHDPKQLWQTSHEILRLLLMGYKYTEVARILNITPQTVSNMANSELGMQKLSEMRQKRDEDAINVSKEIAELYPKALKVYNDILESDEAAATLKKEVADTVLMDIGGHRAATKVSGNIEHNYLIRQELVALVARGKEVARASGFLVDITPEKEGE